MTKMFKRNQYRQATQQYVDNLDYVDGTYDKHGNQLSRPLTDAEKAYLDQFNQEYYLNNCSYEKRILPPEFKQQASKDNNARSRDLLTSLSSLVISTESLGEQPCLEDTHASTLKIKVEDLLKKHDIKETINILINESVKDVDDCLIETKVILEQLVISTTLAMAFHRKNENKLKRLNKK